MSETPALLHNSGFAPYASITWNGPAKSGDAAAWTFIKAQYRGPKNDPAGPAALLDDPAAETSRALLRLLGRDCQVADTDAALLALLRQRIAELQLPPATPRLTGKTYDKELRYPAGVMTDLLSVLALQAHSVGSLLVRDGEPNLGRLLWRDVGSDHDAHWWRVWFIELAIEPHLRKRLATYDKTEEKTA